MFIRRFVKPVVSCRRPFCQMAKKENSIFKPATHYYTENVGAFLLFSLLGSFFIDKHDSVSIPEHFIYCITKGVFIGLTFPLSYPLITANVLRKKYWPQSNDNSSSIK